MTIAELKTVAFKLDDEEVIEKATTIYLKDYSSDNAGQIQAGHYCYYWQCGEDFSKRRDL